MALIIDGYNLMHAAGIVGRGAGPGSLERSRLAVLNFVVESFEPADLAGATVVFDAQHAPRGLPSELRHRGIAVRFAVGYESADELIEELIEHDSAPRNLVVVSSDHRLHRAARRRKAQAIDSDRWYEQTISRRRERRQQQTRAGLDTAKPMPPFARSEVEFWLSRFADEPAAVREESSTHESSFDQQHSASQPAEELTSEAIFPPEYLDEIEKELGE